MTLLSQGNLSFTNALTMVNGFGIESGMMSRNGLEFGSPESIGTSDRTLSRIADIFLRRFARYLFQSASGSRGRLPGILPSAARTNDCDFELENDLPELDEEILPLVRVLTVLCEGGFPLDSEDVSLEDGDGNIRLNTNGVDSTSTTNVDASLAGNNALCMTCSSTLGGFENREYKPAHRPRKYAQMLFGLGFTSFLR